MTFPTLRVIDSSCSSSPSRSNTSQSSGRTSTNTITRPMKAYIKDIFSKKSSTAGSDDSITGGNAGFYRNNPFGSNPSPPTRRPAGEAPPPSYAEATSPSSPTAVSHAPTSFMDDDPFEFLEDFDTVLLIDDSASMTRSAQGDAEMPRVLPGHQTKWQQVSDCLSAIVPVCTKYDSDGIDIHFLNHRTDAPAPEGKTGRGYYNVTTPQTVRNIFNDVIPGYGTKTGLAINRILQPYMRQYKDHGNSWENIKPVNLIVITDGAAKDDPEGVIRGFAKQLDQTQAPAHQVGIQFFQVGEWSEATIALRDLDDNIVDPKDPCRDIVDTVTFDASRGGRYWLTADAVLKTVLGAVSKKLDRKTLTRFHGVPSHSRYF